LDHLKATYDNKAFSLSHCWIVIKDSKKWEDSFVILRRKRRAKAMHQWTVSSTLMTKASALATLLVRA
jgi:hypothetical protein